MLRIVCCRFMRREDMESEQGFAVIPSTGESNALSIVDMSGRVVEHIHTYTLEHCNFNVMLVW